MVSPLVWKWGVPGQSFVAVAVAVFSMGQVHMYFRITTNKNTWAVDPHSFFCGSGSSRFFIADPDPA